LVQVLIHGGDFSNVGLPEDIEGLNKWLGELPYKHKIVIAGTDDSQPVSHTHARADTARARWCGDADDCVCVCVPAGNHDLTFDPQSYGHTWRRFGHKTQHDCAAVKASLKNCTYLEDELVEVEGIRIYGSPWQPEFCDWAFNLPRYASIIAFARLALLHG
jgi:hypothetical protein